ncbi:probable disease resistance protein At5g63020 [Vitis riparia]|uniref:probable disease resistance protein At5g63020 n=1 Tax=Vitis riparia TaxID=96939 RepID=UPI00155A5A86|nr:probable disease resistance protein At5g63020 [Vitis riparia]
MGNVCSVSISIEDIARRCCDCIAARANYICKLQENRVTLRTELQKLRALRNDVKRKVDVAERQQMKRLDQVQVWLSSVEDMETEVTQLIGDGAENIEEKRFCGSCYPKHCISSYTLGKKVVRNLQDVAILMSEGRNFEVVADIVPPAPVEEIPSRPTVGLESTFDRVWRCLGEEHVGMIGLYGLGGAGKTTLLTQINNHFLKTSHNFDVVIWVVVSKTPNLDEVQNEIWEKVGFCDDKWKSKSRHGKAIDIWKALSKKRFVMLLDDMWEQMDLLEVGIPSPDQQNKSKLIFTTRSQDLCGQMGAHEKIQVKSLAWRDSWDLFKKYVGEDTLNSDPQIPELAEIVARECCGLPLVIITIGRAMASKVTPQDWKHAIRVLQTSASKFPGMEDPVYPRLKYSYDSLPTKIVQSCFLYCSLFPEDFSIDKEALIWKWICEGFLDEYDDVDGAKNQGFNIINTLIHACLLEEPLDTNYVKLHDVIRDMALWITGDTGEMKGKFLVQTSAGLTQAPEFVKWTTAERISLMQNRIKKLIGSPTCPNLSTLLLDSNRPLNVISDAFFQFMPNLRVLSLNGTNIIELPSDISNSVSLQYLDLSWTRILRFPVGMKNLVKLKRLELACTDELSSIPRGLISSLSMLQTINLYRCGFKPDGNESLVEELESLKYLVDLRITIVSACVFERFLSSRKLRSCTHGICLRIFKGSISFNVSSLENIKHLNSFWMEYCDTLIKFDWAEKGKETVDYSNLNPKVKCFNGLETVTILGCRMLKNLTWLIFAPKLKYLEIALCQQMEEVIGKGEEDGGNLSPFTNLIEVRLLQLPQLKSMYWNPLPFLYLERIIVARCPKLKKLPLNSNSARERRVMIEGEEKWWNELEWEDEATLNTFLPNFQAIL